MKKCKNKLLGLLLTVAIAFSTLLPFFATYGHVSAATKLTAIFGEKILICTGEGFAWVKWEDLLAGKSPAQPHKEFFCPLCYLAATAFGKIMLAAGVIFFARQSAAGPLLFSSPDARLRQFAWATAHPRAPPVSFSY